MSIKNQAPPLSSEDSVFFQEFYEENKGFLYYIARQYASCECDDLIQEALLRLMRSTERLRLLNRQQAAKYIALTVRSVYLDMLKKQTGSRTVSLDDPVLELLQSQASREQNPLTDEVALKLEVSELKASLDSRDWQVLEGKYILGYDQRELSRRIGVSPDSIRMILSRARKKARSILLSGEENGGGSHE